jgi:catecholate siderophore receptor
MPIFRFWKISVGDLVVKLTVACVSSLLHRDFDRRFTAAAFIFAAGCIPPAIAAAASKSHVFDLPADVASKTLQQFAEQAGTEVVFASDSTARIRTNAVQGRFTPQEAIERLLRGTGLVAERSARTGAFTVLRASLPQPPREAPPVTRKTSPDQGKPDDMNSSAPKTRNFLTILAGWLAVAASPGEAQTVTPAPSAPPQEETLMLSPFTVQSERDTGYQATSTLAGTRLNTPLKDLGASISIYTKDFLEDIGATNSNDLLIYATGMEAAGAGGNFSGASNDINAENVVAQASRSDPQNGTRTRGLAAPNFSRGFFASEISLDSYNTEAVTVNRGPNAILFGVGSPAGVVEQTLLRGDLRRNRNKVEIRVGNNDSLRSAVDFNRVLIEKKLAIRLAGLHDNEKFNQRPAFDEKKRIYGALTFEPFKSTALRASFESGHGTANRPLTILPANSVSAEWLAAGRPGYDWSFYDDPARNPNAATQVAGPTFEGPLHTVVPFSGTGTVIYNQPGDQMPSFAFHGTTRNTSATAANSIRNQLFHPLVNRDAAADTISFLSTANLFELPASWWTGANVLPGQQPGQRPAGLKVQGFTDFSVFDFKNRMIDESSRQRESFHAFNIALEQRAWNDRVGIELAYDAQRRDRRVKNSLLAEGSTNHIRIDTTVTLPTGERNPNLGRPFAEAHGANFPTRLNERETMRATAFLKYDFKDLDTSWSKWLGRHTLTGLLERASVDTITYNNLYAIDGPAARSASAAINQRRPAVVVYLGPSIIGNNNPLQLQAAKIPEIKAGPLGVPSRYFVREPNATDPGHFEDGPASLVETLAAANASREVIKSQAAVLQSYWLRDHLITLVGWRRDEDFFINQNFNPVTNPNDLNDPGRTQAGFGDFSFENTPPPNVAAEVKSYSGVLRWPRKFIKLPQGTDVSVSYNRSSNFTPAGGRYSALGGTLPSPEGDTKEYGVSISAFHDKLTVRINRFETSVQGQSFNPTAFQNAQWFGMAATARVWAEEANINPHLAAMRNADIDRLFGALPPSFRELHNFQVSGSPPNLSATTTRVSGATDTTDFVAKGTEVELVFNPTRNWRILANVAKQETVQSNMLPSTRDLVARLTPIWTELADRPKNNYPLGWQPGTPLPANVQTYGDWLDQNVFVPLATALATEGVASAEQRKWRANLVTNYTFGRGSVLGDKLKGWGIGGAVRWQDKLGLGYPTSRNPDGSGSIDLAHPYYAPDETNVDAWVSYGRKLWNGRIDWKVQLNVRNLYRDRDLIPIGVQPWGEIATVRLAPERRWYLTNTFSF